MNILIPHKWLLEHLETKAKPEDLARCLSLCGPSIERMHQVGGDTVYDIEVTTNRVDAMSIRGIAREAATILPEFGIAARLKPKNYQPTAKNIAPKLDFKIVNDPKLSHRILAIKLTNVAVGPSPKWLTTRLEQVGQRPLNNLIDITNYVMWELGHPVHAFDYDRLAKKTIIVREARAGEKLTTLDNRTISLVGGEVVYDDGTGTIIDLPGIMGTHNTVITNQTKNVLLWIESNVAEKIRFASMTHTLRSQAAILNEKHVDPELSWEAINRAVELYQQIANAKIGSQLVDIYPKPPTTKPVTVKQALIDTYMGLKVPEKRIVRILENLGCLVESNSAAGIYTVTPPSYRARDITIPQDVIEEIARIYGYHNLPSQIMATTIPDTPASQDFDLEYRLKTWLAGWGAQEIYTYSLVSAKLAAESGYSLNTHLRLKNPLTDDLVYLRRSLIPSLTEVIRTNHRDPLTVFELQNVYHPNTKRSGLPTEELQLAILTNHSYLKLKGIVDALMNKLYIENFVVKPAGEVVGEIYVGKTKLGTIGQLRDSKLYALTINIQALRTVAKKNPQYLPVTNLPPIIEDLTFSILEKTHLGPVIETIKNISSLIQSVELKDVYQGRNYTFTIVYRHPERSLTDKELMPIRKKIVSSLGKAYSANLVGSL